MTIRGVFEVCGFSGGVIPVLAVLAVDVVDFATATRHTHQDQLVT